MNLWMLIICVCSACFTFVFIFLLAKSVFWNLERGIVAKQGLTHYETKNTNQLEWLFRNGFNPLKNFSKYLLSKSKALQRIFDEFVEMLAIKKIISDSVSALSVVLLIGFVLSLLGTIIFGSLVAGFATVLLLIVIFITSLRANIDKRNERLRESIPESLRSMGSCFKSGYTLLQTFDFLSKQDKNQLNLLYGKCANKLHTGGTIPESLEILRKEKSAPELVFVAVALDVQHQSGGSMAPVIEAARDMVESKLDLLRKLSVQTAQAKLSARVVTILPFALIACFSIISPDFLSPFFSSILGMFVLGVACLMQFAGVICVRKMLNVEV